MKFHIISLFPDILDSYLSESIIGRAIKAKKIKINKVNPRKWGEGKHKRVDDTPFGGGAGMLMKVEPVYRALRSVHKRKKKGRKVVMLSAKGKRWNQQMASEYAKLDEIVLICGRYEGIDERITEFIDEEISIGDFVLTGGEIGALTIIDSVTRLIPEVLGNKESIIQESHTIAGKLEHPQYTKPAIWRAGLKKYKVPEVLLSGNHKKIEEWKEKNSKIK